MLLNNEYPNIYMKNTISLVVVSLMAVLMLGVVSAIDLTNGLPEQQTTIIAGKIYNSDYTAVIAGADVDVTCDGVTISVVSKADGAYKVEYTDGSCYVGDSLTVYAEKDGLTGQKTGTILAEGTCSDPNTDNCLINVYDGLDVAVVNVPLVPEFGAIVGVLTILGAVGVFFVVRRR